MSIADLHIEDVVTFTVPYITPPSVNHYTKSCYYRGADGQSHKGKKRTPEANAFREAVAIFARGRTVAPPTNNLRSKAKYKVEITLTLGKNVRLDADNGMKVALDALQWAGVIHSDAFVVEAKAIVIKDNRENPSTAFLVIRTEP
jgi:Holliday junction resolvase RusA-like endonuclease